MLDDYEVRMGAFECDLPKDAHPDVFVGDLAADWQERMQKLDAPLFIEVGFPGPHPPLDPVPEQAKEYVDKDLPMPAVTDDDIESQPPALRALRRHHASIDHDSICQDLYLTDDQLHRMRAYQYANVAIIHEGVGAIMDALETNVYGDDTVVIFTSDQGEMLGDHGHIQKWTMYEEVMRVPTIM